MTSDLAFVIRDATAADADAIARNNARVALETEDQDFDAGILRESAAAVLTDPAKGRYWLAESDGRTVGQIMVTLEWSDWRNGFVWWIQSVFVEPDWRRRGVFSALYRHVESLARGTPECRGLRLYVERHNRTARQAYARLGMTEPGYLVMEQLFD